MTTAHPPTHPPALEFADLTKSFTAPRAEPVRAVRGIDLRIDSGEVVALLGPNGAGKTTALDIALGLTEATGGRARIFGQAPRKAVADGRVSAVLQTGGLLSDLTVSETVRAIAALYRNTLSVGEVLERAGLSTIAGRRVARCSGGEQQRLRFALALLPDPDLLILDEPLPFRSPGRGQHRHRGSRFLAPRLGDRAHSTVHPGIVRDGLLAAGAARQSGSVPAPQGRRLSFGITMSPSRL